MVEVDIIRCLKQISLSKTDIPFIVGGQSGVHPMDKVFCLVENVQERNIGTSSKPLTSRDGVWRQIQAKRYEVRISLQGLITDNVGSLCEELKLLMDITPVRQIFNDLGYTYNIDDQTIVIPVQLNTDQYVRYSFTVDFNMNKLISYSQPTIDHVELHGKVLNPDGSLVAEFEDDVPSEKH